MMVIIDYGIGNLASIANMLKKCGVPALISSNHSDICRADKLILPGVGSFDNGMKQLGIGELARVLSEKIVTERTPVLGICLGMQLFTRKSGEGVLQGLGWVDADTIRFAASAPDLKIPHMGWNDVKIVQAHPLFDGLETSRFYFVHSYHVRCHNAMNVLATAIHGVEFTAAYAHANIMGVQFHPEKSHKFGMKLLSNFAGI